VAQVEDLDAALLVGSNVRKEQPIIGHRLRKAVRDHGARVSFLNTRRFDFHFEVDQQIVCHADAILEDLAAIGAVVAERTGATVPEAVRDLVGNAEPDERHRAVAEALTGGGSGAILLGSQAIGHPEFAQLRSLANAVAGLAGVTFGYLPEGGNSCGAWLAGAVPHRGPAGAAADRDGATADRLLAEPYKGYLLLGVEPEYDAADPATAVETLGQADHVISIASFTSDAMLQYADIILPLAAFAETDGTLVNAEGLWQTFTAAGSPQADSRAGWKILRVLANELGVAGFDYFSADEVRRELKEACRSLQLDNSVAESGSVKHSVRREGLVRVGNVPLYSTDPVVRRSKPLQQAADAGRPIAVISPADADSLGLAGSSRVLVRQGRREQVLELQLDDGIARGCVWIPQGLATTAELGPNYAPVELTGA